MAAASLLVALALLIAPPGPLVAETPAQAPAPASGAVDVLRQQCIAAARDVQQREQAMLSLQHQIDLLEQDAAGRQRDLDGSRPEQAHLLGALLFLSRSLGNPFAGAVAAAAPLDRARGALLVKAIVPELRAEARALAGEVEQLATLRTEIASRHRDLGGMRTALGDSRAHLRGLVARRAELLHRLLPSDGAAAAPAGQSAELAKNIDDLIRLADAATERRGQRLLGHARGSLPKAKADAPTIEGADPTRPAQLRAFAPPQSALVMPVSGTISRQFGASEEANAGKDGIGLTAAPGAEVVAPFDGQVVYAGNFGELGLVLIIRHGRLYHSLLAGWGRIDAEAGQWVLSGEPVGVMPDRSGGLLFFEVRREGAGPVDPQPLLASRNQSGGAGGRDEPGGERRVSQ